MNTDQFADDAIKAAYMKQTIALTFGEWNIQFQITQRDGPDDWVERLVRQSKIISPGDVHVLSDERVTSPGSTIDHLHFFGHAGHTAPDVDYARFSLLLTHCRKVTGTPSGSRT